MFCRRGIDLPQLHKYSDYRVNVRPSLRVIVDDTEMPCWTYEHLNYRALTAHTWMVPTTCERTRFIQFVYPTSAAATLRSRASSIARSQPIRIITQLTYVAMMYVQWNYVAYDVFMFLCSHLFNDDMRWHLQRARHHIEIGKILILLIKWIAKSR